MQTLLPHFNLSHPSMYWPALAHLGGPVAVQQRHVTLGRSGLCHLDLPPPYSCAHLPQTFFDPSSFALHPSIPSLPFTRARPGRAGVAGATFLTFHFMRSASVTLDQALGCAPAPSPHRQAGYNAKHVGSLQHQNTDSLLPLSSLFIPQHP